MKILVIYHHTLENTNVFVTDADKVEDVINKLCNETNTDIGEWKIRVLTEGEKFTADMTI